MAGAARVADVSVSRRAQRDALGLQLFARRRSMEGKLRAQGCSSLATWCMGYIDRLARRPKLVGYLAS